VLFVRSIQMTLVSVCLFGSFNSTFADSNWPGWRGPRGDGHSLEKGLPTEWSSRSVVWKKTLNGVGQSSPTIWGNRIFLTSALERGRKRVVMCLDRTNGKLLWEQLAWTGSPEKVHSMNSWASPTCSTDGKYVFAFFGKGGGLFCYTVDGKPVWQKNLGEFVSPWGTAACPVLAGDLVIQNCDADQNAFIAGFDKATGKQVWKMKRDEFRGWSTPVLIHVNGRDELVINGHTGARAYDPATGKELWHYAVDHGRGSPTVTPGNGLVHVVEGRSGGTIYAVRPGGNGDITNTHRAWSRKQTGGRDLPSPLVFGKYLHVVTKSGNLVCYESLSGKLLWKTHLNGAYSGSPVAYNGLLFFLNEDGETTVLKPGDKPNIVRRNKLGNEVGEIFRASITPSDGQVFIRSNKVLYCLGNVKTTAAK
jgi:outer membrane protein assembly factor BamB